MVQFVFLFTLQERDKMILCRMIIIELVQALKFKTSIPDCNFIMLINLILQDSGGAVPTSTVLEHMHTQSEYPHVSFSTNAADCMKLHLGDILEFLTDFHTISKMKSYQGSLKGTALNDDTLGGIVKSSLAQYLALEVTRSNGRDNKAVSKYFPWLCNVSVQSSSVTGAGARDFIDCIGHIRLLSWLLLGSLTHTAMNGGQHQHMAGYIQHAQPIPQESSCQVADHIQLILAGFAEQPKASVLHMSSLFHVFILCQLWTIYLEQGHYTASAALAADSYIHLNILFDFWGKVTPSILQLISHSKMVGYIRLSNKFMHLLL